MPGVKAIEQGKQVGSGLAAARAGLDHDVAPGHEIGQSVGLHGHEARPRGAGTGFPHGFGEIFKGKRGKRVFGGGDVELFVRGGIGHVILH